MENIPGGRWWRWPATALGVLVAVPVLLWVSWPVWFPPLAEQLAEDAGITISRMETDRPTFGGISITQLDVTTGGLDLGLTDAAFTWTLRGLLDGRVAAFTAASTVITQQPHSEPAEDTGPSSFDSAFIPALPIDTIDVRRLVFNAPDLPLRMEGTFRLAEKEIRLRLKATQSPADIPVRLTLRLDEKGQFLARLHSSDDKDQHALEARGALADGVLGIKGDVDFGDYELSLLTGLLGLTGMTGTVTGPFSAAFDADWKLREADLSPVIALQAVTEAGRKRRFSLAGDVSWRIDDTGTGLLSVALADTSVSRSTSLDVEVRPDPNQVEIAGTWALSRSDFSSLMALAGTPELEGSVSGNIRLTAPLPAQMDLIEVSASTVLALNWDRTTDIRIGQLDVAHRSAEPWSIKILDLDYRETEDGAVTAFTEAEATIDLTAGENTSFSFKSRGTAGYDDGEIKLVMKDLEGVGKGEITAAGSTLAMDVAWRSHRIPVRVAADATLNRVNWDADIDWQVKEPVLSGLLGMKEDYDVVAGRFAGTLNGTLEGEALTTTVQGAFTEGRLKYGEYEAKNVSVNVAYQQAPDESWQAELKDGVIGVFDPGVPVEDIRFAASVTDKIANVSTTSARLLGGSVAIKPFDYDMNLGEGAFEVDVSGIDLGALLALEGEDLNGTGTLDGHLPVRVTAEGVTVKDGTLRTTGPGVIRVAESLTRAVNQPGMDFVLRALEDFSYTSLESDVSYAANGDLLAAIRLKGRNPAIEKGRPIHYNLNVSENIPSLLASLRVQDDVNERVERRVREGARK